MGRVMRGIDHVRDGYAYLVGKTLRLAIIGVVLAFVFGAGIYGLALRTPTGFLPEEDQGGFFVAIQLPDGASVARTSNVVRRVETLAKGLPGVKDTFAIIGFSLLDSAQESNAGFMFIKLKPVRSDRTAASDKRAQALIRQHVRRGAANPLRHHLPVQPAADHRPVDHGRVRIPVGGAGGPGSVVLGQTMNGLLAAANADPRMARVFSTFTATNPSLFLDINREKAQALGLSITDVFTALQATLGGIYINDFNLFGRVWQVNIEGEEQDRSKIDDLWKIYIRNKTGGTVVPLRAIADMRIVLGPQVITRYNNYRSITINGSPAPGQSSGAALQAMTQVSANTCRLAMGSSGRAQRIRRWRPRGRRGSSSLWPSCSPICSWSRCMKAG